MRKVLSHRTQAGHNTQPTKKAVAAAVTAAARSKFGSTSLAEAARRGGRGMRALKAVEEVQETVGGGGGVQRRRTLSDVSVRSSRKGRTRQGKKTRLIDDGDDDEVAGSAVEIVEID